MNGSGPVMYLKYGYEMGVSVIITTCNMVKRATRLVMSTETKKKVNLVQTRG